MLSKADRLSLKHGFKEHDDSVTGVPVVVEAPQEFELVDLLQGDDSGPVQVKLNRFLDGGEVGSSGVDQDVIDVEKDNINGQTVTAPLEAEEKSRAYFAKIPLV